MVWLSVLVGLSQSVCISFISLLCLCLSLSVLSVCLSFSISNPHSLPIMHFMGLTVCLPRILVTIAQFHYFSGSLKLPIYFLCLKTVSFSRFSRISIPFFVCLCLPMGLRLSAFLSISVLIRPCFFPFVQLIYLVVRQRDEKIEETKIMSSNKNKRPLDDVMPT